jgi:hypothetical protein
VTATLWNRLTLDVFAFAQWGHVLLDDLAQEIQGDYGGYWAPCQQIDAQVAAYLAGEPGASIAGLKSKDIARCSQSYANNYDWVNAADFIRLGTASMSYRLPEEWLTRVPGGFDQATVQLQAQNLWVWTKFEGLHPDALINTAASLDRAAGYILPPPVRVTLNVRLNF